MSTQKTR